MGSVTVGKGDNIYVNLSRARPPAINAAATVLAQNIKNMGNEIRWVYGDIEGDIEFVQAVSKLLKAKTRLYGAGDYIGPPKRLPKSKITGILFLDGTIDDLAVSRARCFTQDNFKSPIRVMVGGIFNIQTKYPNPPVRLISLYQRQDLLF